MTMKDDRPHPLRLAALVAALVLPLGACASSDPPSAPDPTGSISSWAALHADEVGEGGDIMDSIVEAAGDYDTVALSAACSDLGDWADQMRSLDPMPGPANVPWQAAITDASLAASSCVEGADELDPAALDRSTDHIASFTENITAATEAIS